MSLFCFCFGLFFHFKFFFLGSKESFLSLLFLHGDDVTSVFHMGLCARARVGVTFFFCFFALCIRFFPVTSTFSLFSVHLFIYL